MSPGTSEQRNPYKGTPPRTWIRFRFIAPDQSAHEVDCLADTGNPFAAIVSSALMAALKHADGPDANANFGQLTGGWIKLAMPELGLTGDVVAYASDAVASATKLSHPDFEGLVGLPLLRMAEYGGNSQSFWIRPSAGSP